MACRVLRRSQRCAMMRRMHRNTDNVQLPSCNSCIFMSKSPQISEAQRAVEERRGRRERDLQALEVQATSHQEMTATFNNRTFNNRPWQSLLHFNLDPLESYTIEGRDGMIRADDTYHNHPHPRASQSLRLSRFARPTSCTTKHKKRSKSTETQWGWHDGTTELNFQSHAQYEIYWNIWTIMNLLYSLQTTSSFSDLQSNWGVWLKQKVSSELRRRVFVFSFCLGWCMVEYCWTCVVEYGWFYELVEIWPKVSSNYQHSHLGRQIVRCTWFSLERFVQKSKIHNYK